MNNRGRIAWLVSLVGILTTSPLFYGCATTTTTVAKGSAADVAEQEASQTALALETFWKRQRRLQDLSWPLLAANSVLCSEDVAYRFGIVPIGLDTLEEENREVASTRLGITEQPQILHATKGSPAELAGLRSGDRILAVNGSRIDKGGKPTEKLLSMMQKTKGKATTFTIERHGEVQTVDVTPIKTCSYPVVLVRDDSLNAFADGSAIYITQGMYRFTEDDAELQLVIAHELAHNAEDHMDKRRSNVLFGTLFDILSAAYGVNTQGAFGEMGARVYSQEFEREADYVGMYALARADIETIEVAGFWRRMAAEYPSSIKGTYTSTHPASAERWANIEATHDELETKRRSGLPLLPERKG